MSQLAEVLSIQKSLEESFVKKMEELEAQIQSANPAKDTVAKIAEKFHTFRDLMYKMLGLLRSQINECSKQVDIIETRHRRKALVVNGVLEAGNEDCKQVMLDLFQHKLSVNLPPSSIKSCHRLGAANKDHKRPNILIHFDSVQTKASIWQVKTRSKGSPVSMKEFLTRSRQAVFGKARQHFGMRSCWTQDCIIVVRSADGSRHKVASMDDLSPLIKKYPKAVAVSTSTGRRGGETVANLKGKEAPTGPERIRPPERAVKNINTQTGMLLKDPWGSLCYIRHVFITEETTISNIPFPHTLRDSFPYDFGHEQTDLTISFGNSQYYFDLLRIKTFGVPQWAPI